MKSQHNYGEVALILFSSFADGLIGVAQPIQMAFLSGAVGLSPPELSFYAAAAQIPWMLKPFMYFWCRSVPFFGTHRKSYLMFASLLASAAWLLLAVMGEEAVGANKPLVLLLFMIVEVHAAVSDLFVDAIIIERISTSSLRTVTQLQSLCAGISTISSLIAGFYITSILETWKIDGMHMAFAALSAVSFLLATFALHEPPSTAVFDSTRTRSRTGYLTSRLYSTTEQLLTMFRSFSNPLVWKPTVYLLVWLVRPSLDIAMLYLFANKLAMPTMALRSMDFSVKVATLSALFFYDSILSKLRIDEVFSRVAIVSSVLLLPSLLVATQDSFDDTGSIIAVNLERVCRSAASELVYRAGLQMAAHVCHQRSEPAFYSILMASMNIGAALSDAVGSVLLWVFGITRSSFSGMVPYSWLSFASVLIPYFLSSTLLKESAAAAPKTPELL